MDYTGGTCEYFAVSQKGEWDEELGAVNSCSFTISSALSAFRETNEVSLSARRC